MSINKDYTMIIDKGKSKLNDVLEIYTNDLGVSIYINILDSPCLKLSNHEDLYAKLVLKDRLGKEIKSNVVPVVNNIVIFNLDKRIMASMTEIGKYSMYIIIMDDKQNKKVLPPVTMTLVESDLVLNELETSAIGSSINDTAVQSYGNELLLFNVDGTYNRTIWVTGDVITTAKMNKIEKAISKIKDKLDLLDYKVGTFDETQVHQFINATETAVDISSLEKGFYIITGRAMDFPGGIVEDLPDGENYFIVTYHETNKISKILRCLANETEFKKLRYDINQKQIFDDEKNIVEVEQGTVDGLTVANVTEDKYQFLHVPSTTTSIDIQLLDIDSFADINLYMVLDGDTNVNFPSITWNKVPIIEAGKMIKLNLVFIDGIWYGFWEGGNT